jgi:hypothetical protein
VGGLLAVEGEHLWVVYAELLADALGCGLLADAFGHGNHLLDGGHLGPPLLPLFLH